MRASTLCLAFLWPALALAQYEEIENPGAVLAVQDRAYRLSHELTVGGGILPLDAFYKGLAVTVGYTYHFSDSFAWQVGRGTYSYDIATGLRKQLERDFGVEATEFEQVQWLIGSDLVWSPLYGKTSVLNRSLLHFEAFLIGGGSVVKSNLSIGPAINLGGGIRLFTGQALSFRLDVTNNFVLSKRPYNVLSVGLAAGFNFGTTE